jgi:hypothetical protein
LPRSQARLRRRKPVVQTSSTSSPGAREAVRSAEADSFGVTGGMPSPRIEALILSVS